MLFFVSFLGVFCLMLHVLQQHRSSLALSQLLIRALFRALPFNPPILRPTKYVINGVCLDEIKPESQACRWADYHLLIGDRQ